MSWNDGSPVIGQIYSDQYHDLFGPPRESSAPLTERDSDIAASLQAAVPNDVSGYQKER